MKDINEYFCKLLQCDSARISKFPDKIYLIIGFKKHTKDNRDSYAEKNGERFDYEYLEEHCVASGKDEEELIKSAKHYKKLCGITMEEFIASGMKLEYND